MLTNKNIHIINPHGIGDIIMMFPLLVFVLESKPKEFSLTVKNKLQSEIIKIFFPDNEFKFIYMDEIYATKFPFFFYIKKIRSLDIDTILTASGVNPLLGSVISIFSGASNRIGWKNWLGFLNTHTINSRNDIHKVFQHLLLVDAHSPVKFIYPKYLFKKKSIIIQNIQKTLKLNSVDTENNRLVAIAPGSGVIENHKRWPAESYRTLAKEMEDYSNIKFILLGNTEEVNLGEKIERESSNIINLIGRLSIEETIYVLSMVEVAVCNCNGLSHLAAAVGTQVLGIYGPTNPHYTGPYTNGFTFVSLQKRCSPCYGRNYIQGCGSPVCMTELPVGLVKSSLLKILKV